jgi:hypothetical protein
MRDIDLVADIFFTMRTGTVMRRCLVTPLFVQPRFAHVKLAVIIAL